MEELAQQAAVASQCCKPQSSPLVCIAKVCLESDICGPSESFSSAAAASLQSRPCLRIA